MNVFLEICKYIGAVTIVAVIGCVVLWIVWGISKIIDNLKRTWRYRHRFGKAPLAKCYCRDCQHFCGKENEDSGLCNTHVGWYVADCWFCWDAIPRKK